jgi:hypothetical protein
VLIPTFITPDQFSKFYYRNALRVFENRVLRKIFGPKRDEVTGGWINLHGVELHNFPLFTKHYISDQIKEDEMGEACSAHGIDEKCAEKFWLESLKGRDHTEYIGVNGRKILK